MKLLDIVHPAAKVLADISMSQDAEVQFYFSKALSISSVEQCIHSSKRSSQRHLCTVGESADVTCR